MKECDENLRSCVGSFWTSFCPHSRLVSSLLGFKVRRHDAIQQDEQDVVIFAGERIDGARKPRRS